MQMCMGWPAFMWSRILLACKSFTQVHTCGQLACMPTSTIPTRIDTQPVHLCLLCLFLTPDVSQAWTSCVAKPLEDLLPITTVELKAFFNSEARAQGAHVHLQEIGTFLIDALLSFLNIPIVCCNPYEKAYPACPHLELHPAANAGL